SDLTGDLFVSRSNAVAWGTIACSSGSLIADEDTALGFSSLSADSINRTFNETAHPGLVVGTETINSDTCRSTSTYVNSTAQDQSSADFPIIVLGSGTDVVYTTPIQN